MPSGDENAFCILFCQPSVRLLFCLFYLMRSGRPVRRPEGNGDVLAEYANKPYILPRHEPIKPHKSGGECRTTGYFKGNE